jgi:hypothetical protein
VYVGWNGVQSCRTIIGVISGDNFAVEMNAEFVHGHHSVPNCGFMEQHSKDSVTWKHSTLALIREKKSPRLVAKCLPHSLPPEKMRYDEALEAYHFGDSSPVSARL